MLMASRFLVASVIALAVASIVLSPESLAKDATATWQAPVIYVTDRQPLKKSFGPRRLVEKDCVGRVQSGIVQICVEQADRQPLQEWQKSGYEAQIQAKQKPVLKVFKGQSIKSLDGDFDDAIRAALKKSASREIFVFVHGFNNSFLTAATNAAELEHYTGCPVILYSWPSEAKLFRYSADEGNNEWSQEHFNQFLEHLTRLKQTEKMKVSIVAHSMGNRLLVRGIPLLAGHGLFSDIYMVNPDFDAQTFMHYLSRYIPENGLVSDMRGQILISRKDNALSAAEALFGGYTRLGQGMDFTLSALTSPAQFAGVWLHGDSQKEESDQATSAGASGIVASIQKAIRIYDVTALDHGVIGHKVPHEFIAWMHQRNQAPPGFTLETDKSRGGNTLSRMFAGKLKKDIGSTKGAIWMVIKSSSASTAAVEPTKSPL